MFGLILVLLMPLFIKIETPLHSTHVTMGDHEFGKDTASFSPDLK